MQRKVLSYKNMPAKMPLMASLFWWMFLDYIKAPGWAFGAMAVLIIVLWTSWVIELFTAEHVELDR